ncbi:transcription factor bHLH168-like [Oryza brachyantha]|uniref:BHLH domain-containing protein n=1 Tax=Oryza brachyantha TaxID=4533 RepID=J3KVQ0_ORYBR|nr:transcription factor bHLH168-like [Oryza brachyantha]
MKSRKQQQSTRSAAGGGGDTSSSGGGGGNWYSSSKMERKDVEKNRRLHMKGLCLKLSSLIPPPPPPQPHHHHHSTSPPSSTCKETVTQLEHLEQAAAYIKQLKGRIDELKKRKQQAAPLSSMPVVEVRCQEGTLDVVVVSEAGDRAAAPVRLHEVIAVLEEEGAEVVNASFSVVGDKIFYTLHSQALCSRVGLDASRVSHRLRTLLLLV